MTDTNTTPTLATLFGSGDAVVLNLPPRFSFEKAVSGATRISLATAFAKTSGWSMVKAAIENSGASLRLVTGLDFCLTEPSVLQAWLKLKTERPRTEAYLAIRKVTFHPKVLVVERGSTGFAIVGSGNLTEGGLRSNVECSTYIDDVASVRNLSAWMDGLCAPQSGTVELRQSDIDAYTPKFKKHARAMSAVKKDQKLVERRIANEHQATMANWDGAVRAARRYFASTKFTDDWVNNWRPAVTVLRKTTRAPRFDYSNQDWLDFFEQWQFGRLIPIFRDVAFREAKRTQAGLRQLAASKGPTLVALDDILEPGGRYNVSSVGVNLVSKVMAVNFPQTWPVFNGPVASVLKSYGYQPPKGASRGANYLAFATLMKRFQVDTGARSMLELDPFFYEHNQKAKTRSTAKE